MNSTSAQYSSKTLPKRGRTSRVLPATLVVLLLSAVPALAEPVKFNQVVQTLTSSRGVLDLRLNTLAQDPKHDGPNDSDAKTKGGNQTAGKTESVISSVVVSGEGKTIGVEEIEDGEVEGTICDCGEIFIAGASFPKWPFLFLAAVPVAFIDFDSDEQPTPTPPPGNSPTPTPTPTATPVPTPEPASLLLFGSGLVAAGAGLRKRYAKSKVLLKKEDE
jgi:PEP-CTERM motif